MSIRVINAVWQNSRQRGNALLLLQAIADFADDDGYAFPAVQTLADKARVSERTARTVIRDLQAAGELAVERNAGPRGANRYRVLVTEARQLALTDTRGAADRRGAATNRVQPVAPEPSSTSRDLSEEVRDGSRTQIRTPAKPAPPLGSRQERKRIEEEAVELWQRLRKRSPHLKRFTEAASIRGLRIAVKRALMAGHTWVDISVAITAKAPEAASNPWYADEWIRVTAERRLETEKEAEQRRQREEAERERDVALTAERAALHAKYPGLTWKEIVERELFNAKPQPGGNVVSITEAASRRAVVDGWPRIVGPDRISLDPHAFRCNGERCPRQGSRWVEMREGEAAIPLCRNCLDFAVAGSDAQREHVSGRPLVATDIDNSQRPRTTSAASQVTA